MDACIVRASCCVRESSRHAKRFARPNKPYDEGDTWRGQRFFAEWLLDLNALAHSLTKHCSGWSQHVFGAMKYDF